MTRITVTDTYLNKTFSLFVNQDYNSIEEVEKELRIHDYLYFPVAAVRPANRIERLIIPRLCSSTDKMEDVLFYNYKYLILK